MGESQDHNGQPNQKPGNRISRILKRRSTTTSSSTRNPPTENVIDFKDTKQKRRQQVSRAQKRHRNRQAEYVTRLEAEIAQLQHLDSVAHAEMNSLAHETQKMRELLAAKMIDYQLESMSLTATPVASEDTSQLGSAAVEVRLDPLVGHERIFVDVSDEFDVSHSNSTDASTLLTKHGAGEGDNWAALDFILALEHCCQDHTVHSGINPVAYHGSGDEDSCYGHALSVSAAVFQSAVPPASNADPQDALLYGGIRSPAKEPQSGQEKWQLPHSEIDKLVVMSEQLPIDDSEMTPAQAYSAIRESVPDAAYVKPVMERLRVLLAPHMTCFGFGAVMPTVTFWEHLDAVLKTLGLEAPQA